MFEIHVFDRDGNRTGIIACNEWPCMRDLRNLGSHGLIARVWNLATSRYE